MIVTQKQCSRLLLLKRLAQSLSQGGAALSFQRKCEHTRTVILWLFDVHGEPKKKTGLELGGIKTSRKSDLPCIETLKNRTVHARQTTQVEHISNVWPPVLEA